MNNNNVQELEEEIEVLKKRVSILEKKENRRTSFKYLKIIIKVILLLLFAYIIWRGYDYVTHEIPNILNNKIKEINPFKKNN